MFWAGQFLDQRCVRTMRSQLEPMKPSKSPCITILEPYPNQNSPIDSGEVAFSFSSTTNVNGFQIPSAITGPIGQSVSLTYGSGILSRPTQISEPGVPDDATCR